MLIFISRVRRVIQVLLIGSLLAMVALTFADVIGRRLFGTPIYGAHDVTEHLMAVIVFCGLPLLTSARGHLVVDLFDRYILHSSMRWWRALVSILGTVILLFLSYQFAYATLDAVDIQEVSQELMIPRSYMYALISLSCLISAIANILPAQKSDDIHPEESI
ncbi:TRAP transporter small permease [Marinobacterium sp. YM272]|uniref:TRAP transporter small permease n=1 Tax=Marinobacterium sp. YM272 TaxID=3421654 RepID=UPI003D7FDCFE